MEGRMPAGCGRGLHSLGRMACCTDSTARPEDTAGKPEILDMTVDPIYMMASQAGSRATHPRAPACCATSTNSSRCS